MSRIEYFDYEASLLEEPRMRRDACRARRILTVRRKPSRKKLELPGGIRQRRNKQWTW
jgi:hypothetical protein